MLTPQFALALYDGHCIAGTWNQALYMTIMDDDDFGTDADFLAALAAHEAQTTAKPKIVQPTPQRLDKAPPVANGDPSAPKVVQPTPQALPSKGTGSSILVSPRQKGNPILTNLRSLPWEYSDIPADYLLGATTCALFLSLKYHRLHPDYIYTRIRNLKNAYSLRIILTMVDIPAHEEPLKELSKTSLVNNVIIILCWSAAEAARYLELYKSYEHANFSAIKEQRGTTYADRMVDFCTVPRSVNKSDVVSLVSAFGSIRAAVNARMEEVVVIGGWGEKKVRNWEAAVASPFRNKQAKRRRNEDGDSVAAIPLSRVPLRESSSMGIGLSRKASSATPIPASALAAAADTTGSDKGKEKEDVTQFQLWGDSDDDDAEEAMAEVAAAMGTDT